MPSLLRFHGWRLLSAARLTLLWSAVFAFLTALAGLLFADPFAVPFFLALLSQLLLFAALLAALATALTTTLLTALATLLVLLALILLVWHFESPYSGKEN
jgi:hypothetical protein